MEEVRQVVSREQILKGKPSGYSPARVEIRDPKRTNVVYIRSYQTSEGWRILDDKINPGKERVVPVKTNMILDLNKEEDYLLFDHIKNHPFCTEKKLLICVSIEDRAKKSNERRGIIANASNIVRELSGDRLYDFAKLMFMNKRVKISNDSKEDLVQDMLYTAIEKAGHDGIEFSKRVIDLDKDKLFDVRVVTYKAIEAGRIVRKNEYYYYGEEILGRLFEDCVSFFEKEVDIFMAVKNDLNG